MKLVTFEELQALPDGTAIIYPVNRTGVVKFCRFVENGRIVSSRDCLGPTTQFECAVLEPFDLDKLQGWIDRAREVAK